MDLHAEMILDEYKSKIELYFAKYYFSIHFIEPLKDEDMKQIKEIFSFN